MVVDFCQNYFFFRSKPASENCDVEREAIEHKVMDQWKKMFSAAKKGEVSDEVLSVFGAKKKQIRVVCKQI